MRRSSMNSRMCRAGFQECATRPSVVHPHDKLGLPVARPPARVLLPQAPWAGSPQRPGTAPGQGLRLDATC
jgi:hypothetical protein